LGERKISNAVLHDNIYFRIDFKWRVSFLCTKVLLLRILDSQYSFRKAAVLHSHKKYNCSNCLALKTIFEVFRKFIATLEDVSYKRVFYYKSMTYKGGGLHFPQVSVYAFCSTPRNNNVVREKSSVSSPLIIQITQSCRLRKLPEEEKKNGEKRKGKRGKRNKQPVRPWTAVCLIRRWAFFRADGAL